MTESTRDEPSRFRKFCRTSNFYYELLKYAVALKFQRKAELRDPQQVLRRKFGDELRVLCCKTDDDLVKFGDGYSSAIVKATIDVEHEGQTKRLNLAVKMLSTSSFVRKFMQCEVIMKKEIFFYEEIIPAYRQLNGAEFDIAPEFYGGRLNMQLGDESGIDDDAVLLMENLRESGYVMADRSKGLTMDQLRIALPAIAKFHALGLAMKQQNPEFFSKIKEQAKPLELPAEWTDIIMSKLLSTVKNKGELNNYYERVKSLGNSDCKNMFFTNLDCENPYACLAHRDLWINNTMLHEDAAGKTDHFKMFDFQFYGISSPMTDLMYFLTTSLSQQFENFDEALELYRESICCELKRLGCNSSLFEGENFDRRLKEDARIELYRCLAMARNVEVRSKWDVLRISTDTVQRMKRILEIYDSKGWLDD